MLCYAKQIIQIVFNETYLSYFKSKRIFIDNTPIFPCGNTPDRHVVRIEGDSVVKHV